MSKYLLILITLALFAFSAEAGMFGEKPKACIAGGCSGQLCVDASQGEVMSTCEWTPAYGCYQKYGTCETQSDNTCGWTQTSELKQCLENPEREFPLDKGVAE